MRMELVIREVLPGWIVIGALGVSALLLTGCARGTVQEALGMGKRAPDEFAVVSRAPLILPPDYEGEVPEGYHTFRSGTFGNWLIWRGGEPADFILRLEFRWEKGNSGVQVRSDDLGSWQVFGYQVEIAKADVMGIYNILALVENDRRRRGTGSSRSDGRPILIDQIHTLIKGNDSLLSKVIKK